MVSPFSTAELVGGPWDGATYERVGDRFPSELPMTQDGAVFLYVAGLGRLGNVVYRFVRKFDRTLEVVT